MQQQVHVLITGKVQGVGYRLWTVNQGEKLGLNGWVRNLQDGRVEAVFEGDSEIIEQMIQACYSGPRAAVVKNVIVERTNPEGIEGFNLRY
jgi:acylphosphatase